jgi:hypothetical protein
MDFNVRLHVAFGIFGENDERFEFELGIDLGLGSMTLQ